jgi:hypothetical protein
MSRTLERRLARLEERLPPPGPPESLEVHFVDTDGEVVETRTFKFPYSPSTQQSTAWRAGVAARGTGWGSREVLRDAGLKIGLFGDSRVCQRC